MSHRNRILKDGASGGVDYRDLSNRVKHDFNLDDSSFRRRCMEDGLDMEDWETLFLIVPVAVEKGARIESRARRLFGNHMLEFYPQPDGTTKIDITELDEWLDQLDEGPDYDAPEPSPPWAWTPPNERS
jgi:hypothetical protein